MFDMYYIHVSELPIQDAFIDKNKKNLTCLFHFFLWFNKRNIFNFRTGSYKLVTFLFC